jgi:two-component system LytT family sensor kinase
MKAKDGEQAANKIKWRQHELILVTAIALMSLIGRLWYIFNNQDQLESSFLQTKTAFNLYKNIVLPDISVGLSLYLTYLLFNLYIIPRLLFPKKVEAGTSKISLSFSKTSFEGLAKKIAREYTWLFIQLILIIFVLGSILNVATYYRHQWLFNYEGFSIFFNENNPKSQMDLGGTFFAAASIVVLYGLYVCVREFIIIQLIQKSKQREYNTLICNKVTSFILQFVCALIFLKTFNIVDDNQFFVSFSLYVPALFAMYLSNVYWLFPMKGDGPFFTKKIIIRLLFTSFVYSLPLVVFIHEQVPVALLYSWAEQLFIVTPLTWWYFQSNKAKILQLRIVEKQLVQSKADIQFLRSQINPHFLFNVLNTLYGTALQENAERTAEGVQRLGDMMRFMLHENNLDFIQMNKEIEYLKNYIALQKLRTQSSLEITIEDNISEQNCHHKIAPMLLIPLVENAFKHGISLKERSWIKIDLGCDERNIFFEVRNSMHEKTANDPEKERSGIGFKNVLERLKLIYHDKFQISFNQDGKEFFVKLSIQPD